MLEPTVPFDLKPIMYRAGLTLHTCQQFDYVLKLVLYFLSKAEIIDVTKEEAEQIVDGTRKKTTGQVFHLLRTKFDFSVEELSVIQRALDERNRFIHGFLSESNERINNPTTRQEVIEEIGSIQETVRVGELEANKILETLLKSVYDFDIDELRKEVNEENRLLNEGE